jgi:hypothetical protein
MMTIAHNAKKTLAITAAGVAALGNIGTAQADVPPAPASQSNGAHRSRLCHCHRRFDDRYH